MEYWQTCDYGRQGKKLNLTKDRLGDFMFHLLKFEGNLSSIFVMRPDFNRCYVQAAIELPDGKKAEFEKASGFPLEPISSLTSA